MLRAERREKQRVKQREMGVDNKSLKTIQNALEHKYKERALQEQRANARKRKEDLTRDA